MAPVLAVGAVVVRGDEILLVRRARDPGRDLWSLPGGRVEHGEYLADALVREVREETGVDVTVDSLLGIFEIVGDEHHFVVLDHTATAAPDAMPTPGDDVSEARWVPLRDVAALPSTPRFVETLRGWGIEI